MERLKLRYKDAVKAAKTLEDILKQPYSVIIRDAAIQRFEYTFEALWKFLKDYLKEKEGVIANSPKACFKDIFSSGFLSEGLTEDFLDMTDMRNETSHTYKEEVAQAIYDKLNKYSSLIKNLLAKFKENI